MACFHEYADNGSHERDHKPSTAEVPVRTRIWCTVPMVVCASFACLAQVSFASQQYAQDSAPYLWMIACVLVAIFGFDSSGSQQLPASRVLDRMPTGGGAPLRFADRAYGVDFSACAETGNQSDASISACRGDNDDLVPGARRFASCRGFDLACDLLQTIYRSSVWQYHGDACRRKNDHRERRCGCPDCGGDRHIGRIAYSLARPCARGRSEGSVGQRAGEQVADHA